MDPISHAALGYTVVRAWRASAPRLAAAACVGALAPDADAVFMPFGWDVYLRVHEAGTHALIGSVPVGLAAAALVRRRAAAPWPALFTAAWLGVLSHLFLDVVSGARIQLGWPMIDGRTLVPLVAMADPWLLAACTAGALLAARLDRNRWAARTAVAAVALGLAIKGVWLLQALGTLPASPAGPERARIIQARWASVREWNVFEATGTGLSQLRIAPDRRPVALAHWPRRGEGPLIERSRELATVRNLRAVHELTFARVHPVAGGSTEVLWSDVRFCWPPERTEERSRGPLILGTGTARIRCAFWAGGTFDAAGEVLNQRVQIFGLWQTRPVGR
ncbi:MAG: metal-dependent hydrolase [Vicinamibacterales bacterium]